MISIAAIENPALDKSVNPRAPHFIRKHRIADAFEDAADLSTAGKLRNCQEYERLIICTHCSEAWYTPERCRLRVCPLCSFKTSKLRARFIQGMCQKMKFPKLLTLTTRRCTGDPGEGIDQLRAWWNELRENPAFEKVQGGAYQIELKPKPDGWHIHIHAILDAPYLPRTRILFAWKKIIGGYMPQVDIRAADNPKAQEYVAKYASKSADFEGEISDVVAWHRATKGKRLFGTFGTFYNKTLDDLCDPDDNPKFTPCCPRCGRSDSACPVDFLETVVHKDTARVLRSVAAATGPPLQPLYLPSQLA